MREADLLIAVSENDEVNLICCLMAKKLGAKHTVARVRNPEYFRDAPILRREIGLDMIINPENAAAQEISRILRVPSAFSVETFARGLVELIGFQTEEGDSLVGKSSSTTTAKIPTASSCARPSAGRGHRAERLVRPADGRPRVRHRHARGDDARAALDGQGHGAHPPREHPWRQPHRTVPAWCSPTSART